MSIVNIGKVLRKFSQKNIDKPNQKLSELKVGSFFEQGKNRKEFIVQSKFKEDGKRKIEIAPAEDVNNSRIVSADRKVFTDNVSENLDDYKSVAKEMSSIAGQTITPQQAKSAVKKFFKKGTDTIKLKKGKIIPKPKKLFTGGRVGAPKGTGAALRGFGKGYK